MPNIETLLDFLNEVVSDEDIIQLNNEIEMEHDGEDMFYSMDEFDDVMYGTTPYDAICMYYHNSEGNNPWWPNCDYFSFNGYGNLQGWTKHNAAKECYQLMEYNVLYYKDEICELLESYGYDIDEYARDKDDDDD